MKLNTRIFPPALAMLVASLAFSTCQVEEQTGEDLAKTYCASCHMFPEPGLLPKSIWKDQVLPTMSAYMGSERGLQLLTAAISPEEKERVAKAGIFPKHPILSNKKWASIYEYYYTTAPDTLTLPSLPAPSLELAKHFKLSPVSLPGSPDITLLKFNPASKTLWCGFKDGTLAALDPQFNLADTFHLNSTPADLAFSKDAILPVSMGRMNPSDVFKGGVDQIPLNRLSPAQQVLKGLNRPVELQMVDLSGDQVPDFVICEYGHFIGNLQWWEANADGLPSKPHLLNNLPGARTVIPTDFNADGKTDLIALFAQGNESIILYENKGGGEFADRMLLRFPPVYGSSFIELADFNNDQFPDLLYANGDNGDYSPVLKPYHGLHLLLNDGHWNFTEQWFYPMNGASKTAARDFDGDGDLDIAAISFFPDFEHHPEAGFLFFENSGKLAFRAMADKATAKGRWMVMTTADLDQDGHEEIIIGSTTRAFRGNAFQATAAEGPQLMVIKKKD